MSAIDTIAGNLFTAELHYDQSCDNPFEMWDTVGMIAYRPSANYGTRARTGEWDDAIAAWYRIGLDRDSDVWERIPPGFRPADELEEWDAIIYTTRQRAEQMHSGPKTTPAQIWEALEQETKTYIQWANGECYGVIILDQDGNDVDSCWGFLGYDDPLEPAREMLKEAEDAERADRARAAVTGGWVTI